MSPSGANAEVIRRYINNLIKHHNCKLNFFTAPLEAKCRPLQGISLFVSAVSSQWGGSKGLSNGDPSSVFHGVSNKRGARQAQTNQGGIKPIL